MKARVKEILKRVEKLGKPENVEGMKRFGIAVDNAYGVSIYDLRPIAKEYAPDHGLALDLWRTGIHEARLLAAFIGDPKQLTEEEMESLVVDIDSWDICDQICSNLFDRSPFAHPKAVEWSKRPEEFVKRAGFVLMAALSVHDKKSPDSAFTKFLPIIKREATDERNFVKKAVNWALRQIGKRNAALNEKAISTAEKILSIDTKASRWIARDALRELQSEKVKKRLKT